MNRKIAAIGTFDGVHLGHQAVFQTMKKLAGELGLQPVALTFDRHPLSLIAPEKAPLLITDNDYKISLIKNLGIEPVTLTFDNQLRETTALEWLKKIHRDFNVDALVAGYDNTFGSDGLNLSLADYRNLGAEAGVSISDAPRIEGISSSEIRRKISEGKIREANDMTGRPFKLSARVTEGQKIGRTLGFPTANLEIDPAIVRPKEGSYAATAVLPDGNSRPALVYIGHRPTLRRDMGHVTEAHILDWTGDLYDKQISLLIHDFLREEMKFDSLDELKENIEKDKENVILALKSV